jgi:two-component system alkaline phosphatase synthesis response regulator PhoP
MTTKILAVDDDPDILNALTMILESEGYEVVTANNGIQALANLRAEKPDLMILDLMMPKMDGFAVCKELQDSSWIDFKDMPILVLSSVREDACRRRYELEMSIELDIDDYIEKPLTPELLVQRVSNLIRRRKKD